MATEATATLAVIATADGKPVTGAMVALSPNMIQMPTGSRLFGAASESSERADLQEDLRGLAQHFALQARARVGQAGAGALRQARRYAEVQAARQALERNGPPALTLEALIARLRRA